MLLDRPWARIESRRVKSYHNRTLSFIAFFLQHLIGGCLHVPYTIFNSSYFVLFALYNIRTLIRPPRYPALENWVQISSSLALGPSPSMMKSDKTLLTLQRPKNLNSKLQRFSIALTSSSYLRVLSNSLARYFERSARIARMTSVAKLRIVFHNFRSTKWHVEGNDDVL